jgi:CheY-like chemotaxis protein
MPQRILVVDDDKSIIKVLRGYLEQSGYQVLNAVDARPRCTCCAASGQTWSFST